MGIYDNLPATRTVTPPYAEILSGKWGRPLAVVSCRPPLQRGAVVAAPPPLQVGDFLADFSLSSSRGSTSRALRPTLR